MDNHLKALLAKKIAERSRKQAEMPAEEVSQESGVPAGPAAADPNAPPGGAPPGGGPPVDPNTGMPVDPNTGMPVDPNTGMPIDPNTGMPIDPNTGMPMDPAAMGGPGGPGGEPPPPPTIDDLVASGDPLVKLIVEMDGKLSALIEAVGVLQDAAGMTVPASEALQAQTEAAATPEPAKPKEPKQAEAPRLIDPPSDDDDDDTPMSLGQAGTMGRGGAKVLQTRLASAPERNKRLALAVRQRRES